MASTAPVIVFVPGAFHSPSSWKAVADALRTRGYTVLTPPLAVCGGAADAEKLVGKGPLDDVDIIYRELLPLLDEGREAVIVSHSYGSLPATLAISGQTVAQRTAEGLKGGVKSTVTIAGFAFPVAGKNIMGGDDLPPPMPYHVVEDRVVHLQETCTPIWYSDLSPEAREAAWKDLHKTQSQSSFNFFPTFLTSQIQIPKVYVLCEQDRAVEPSYQEAFAQVGKYDKVVRLPSGHAPMLSMPGKVVDIVVDAARS